MTEEEIKTQAFEAISLKEKRKRFNIVLETCLKIVNNIKNKEL